MIVVGGGGSLLVLLVLLAVMALFVMLPFLLLRAVARRVVQPIETETFQDFDAWAAPGLPEVEPADVASLRDRLGHDVRTLDPGADRVSRQALADAAERYSTSGTLLERAASPAQLRTTWLAVVEGLAATRVVRARLGLDPGPPLPALPTAGPQLTGATRVAVGGSTHLGGSTYEPGRSHWFPGGRYAGQDVPGGWYDAPLWPVALLGGLTLGGWAAEGWSQDETGGDPGFGGFGGGSGWDTGGSDGFDGGDSW